MSRWAFVLVLFLFVQWARPAAANQLPGVFDAAGMTAMPLVTFGSLQLGHFVDSKMEDRSGAKGSAYSKLFFIIGTAAMYPALYGLAKATSVPVTWGSAAVGMGFGALTGIALLGLDAGLMAAFNIKGTSATAGVLALVAVVGWGVATTLFIKADPLHLTRTSAPLGQVSASLLSVSF